MNKAARIRLSGRVQGIGMRPAIVRSAQAHGLTGWVANGGDGVVMHVQGNAAVVDEWIRGLAGFLPAQARIDTVQVSARRFCSAVQGFVIRPLRARPALQTLPNLPADNGICKACLEEMNDRYNRRYQWPFISCVDCGSRYAWLTQLPFVRENTTFRYFTPCPECQREYADPGNRRFGMELIACPACGPVLQGIDATGTSQGFNAVAHAARALREGKVVAVQGMCGSHLLALAGDEQAVARIRSFKQRPFKPLALLCENLAQIQALVRLDAVEQQWLESPQRPVVVAEKRDVNAWQMVAPLTPRLGVMLPCNGIEAMLAQQVDRPLVATSGNRRSDPVAVDPEDIRRWLDQGIDMVLVHDIPVWQAQDDSVILLEHGLPLLLRRARGFVHELLPVGVPGQALAQAGFLKTHIALQAGNKALVSQYTGDADNVGVQRRKYEMTQRLLALTGVQATRCFADAHPEAGIGAAATRTVFHHHAHVAALLGESGFRGNVLVAAWDGLGWGADDHVLGSEVYRYAAVSGLRPVARLAAFALPGGDRCSHDSWRVACSLLALSGIPDQPLQDWLTGISPQADIGLFMAHLARVNVQPHCSSMGRFLEALACIILQQGCNEHEGWLAGQLEFHAMQATRPAALCIDSTKNNGESDWTGLVRQVFAERQAGASVPSLAAGVLEACADWLVDLARNSGETVVGVSGGCFQNLYLLRRLREKCDKAGLTLLRPVRLPPNDGALGYGQLVAGQEFEQYGA